MNYKLVIFLPAFLFVVSASHAGPGHHGDNENVIISDNASQGSVSKPESTTDSLEAIWANLQTTVEQLELEVSQASFNKVDQHNHTLEKLVEDLKLKEPHTNPNRQRRFKGALLQLERAVSEIHEQGHNATKEGLTKALSKLRGAMRMVEVYLEE